MSGRSAKAGPETGSREAFLRPLQFDPETPYGRTCHARRSSRSNERLEEPLHVEEQAGPTDLADPDIWKQPLKQPFRPCRKPAPSDGSCDRTATGRCLGATLGPARHRQTGEEAPRRLPWRAR